MAYCGGKEVVLKILRGLTPPKIVLITPPGIDGKELLRELADEGYYIFPQGRDTNLNDERMIIVYGDMSVGEALSVFERTCSYIYAYPNSEKNYAALLAKSGGDLSLTKSYVEKNREKYKEFREEFEYLFTLTL